MYNCFVQFIIQFKRQTPNANSEEAAKPNPYIHGYPGVVIIIITVKS
jgi:hypothetical protein